MLCCVVLRCLCCVALFVLLSFCVLLCFVVLCPVLLCCVVLCCVVLCCVVLCCVVLCCVVLCCVVLCCVLSCCVVLCCVVLCCVVLCCVVLCCVLSCCVVLCCVVLCCVVLCCVVLCCVVLCCVVLCCVVLCCVVLCCVVLCCVVLWHECGNGARFVALPLHASIALIHNTTQHNTAHHNTTQHNTTHHNTTQHYTTQHNTTPPSSGVGRCRQGGLGGYFSPLCWPAMLTRLFSKWHHQSKPMGCPQEPTCERGIEQRPKHRASHKSLSKPGKKHWQGKSGVAQSRAPKDLSLRGLHLDSGGTSECNSIPSGFGEEEVVLCCDICLCFGQCVIVRQPQGSQGGGDRIGNGYGISIYVRL